MLRRGDTLREGQIRSGDTRGENARLGDYTEPVLH